MNGRCEILVAEVLFYVGGTMTSLAEVICKVLIKHSSFGGKATYNMHL